MLASHLDFVLITLSWNYGNHSIYIRMLVSVTFLLTKRPQAYIGVTIFRTLQLDHLSPFQDTSVSNGLGAVNLFT